MRPKITYSQLVQKAAQKANEGSFEAAYRYARRAYRIKPSDSKDFISSRLNLIDFFLSICQKYQKPRRHLAFLWLKIQFVQKYVGTEKSIHIQVTGQDLFA